MKLISTDSPLSFSADVLEFLPERLNANKGMYMASGTDYPGRYSRWDVGFDCPPVEITGYPGKVVFKALNTRGVEMLKIFENCFKKHSGTAFTSALKNDALECEIAPLPAFFAEEDRSRQPSPLSPLRTLISHMQNAVGFAGFFGAFKYDLLFCFNPIELKQERDDKSVFHLYIPDRLYIVDRRKETAFCREFDFADETFSTASIARPAHIEGIKPQNIVATDIGSNMDDSAYADMVVQAKERIRKGDVFEVVLSRRFEAGYQGSPSTLFSNLRRINPSPYEFLLQLGDQQLIGASPEMFVRLEGKRVESCPISGTARRSRAGGQTAVLEDARILQALLNSEKDEAELTMCTDVDRNDKARICVPGSVQLLARRQIEAYTGLYHTVDHVEGTLRDGFDGIDAFLTHMWAVTLTGAPKMEAAKIIEAFEPNQRHFYGAAIGALMFNGDVNTGITIRTLHLKNGHAYYQSGASIVQDSVPEEEAAETHTKAGSFRRILSGDVMVAAARPAEKTGLGKTVILIDNDDSFVHTLADYIRQTGATAVTYRHGVDLATLLSHKPDLIVHSPGPGLPSQFRVPDMVQAVLKAGIPQFGVCLGLQGMFEAFGGTLGYLEKPRHGKTWTLTHTKHQLFEGLPDTVKVGAYHSIYGIEKTLPDDLEITARNENGVIMAIAHKSAPVWAVQFHPESVLSMEAHAGIRMIENVLKHLAGQKQ